MFYENFHPAYVASSNPGVTIKTMWNSSIALYLDSGREQPNNMLGEGGHPFGLTKSTIVILESEISASYNQELLGI